MTPKEKAKDLVVKLMEITPDFVVQDNNIAFELCRQHALIAVDEIMRSNPRMPSDIDWDDAGGTHQYYYEAQFEEAFLYWQEVKKELEAMK